MVVKKHDGAHAHDDGSLLKAWVAGGIVVLFWLVVFLALTYAVLLVPALGGGDV